MESAWLIDKDYKPWDIERLTLEEFHALIDHEKGRRKQAGNQRAGQGTQVDASSVVQNLKDRAAAIEANRQIGG